MKITLIILIILSLASFIILYILEKFILKNELSLKKIYIPITIATLFSITGSIILFILFDYLHNNDKIYIIPLIAVALYLIIVYIQYVTKFKTRSSFLVFIIFMLSPLFYLNFKSTITHDFLFNINRVVGGYEKKVDNTIENRYIALLLNTSDEEENINLKVLDKSIKVIKPEGVIKINAHQKIKLNITLASEIKNIKEESVSLEISSDTTTKIRKVLFIYR